MSNITRIISGNKVDLYLYVLKLIQSEFKLPTEAIDSKNFPEKIKELGTRANLLYINKGDMTKLGVEQVSLLLDFAIQKPHLSEYSLAIIDDVETLSIEAGNKLLKIIEEPPPYLYIILLTTNLTKILSTIKSRSLIIELSQSTELEQIEGLDIIGNILELSQNQLIKIYSDLNSLIQKKPDNQSKKIVLTKFTKIVNSQVAAYLVKPNLTNKELLAKLTKLSQTLSQINKALEANVNIKLIIDRLFLELFTLTN